MKFQSPIYNNRKGRRRDRNGSTAPLPYPLQSHKPVRFQRVHTPPLSKSSYAFCLLFSSMDVPIPLSHLSNTSDLFARNDGNDGIDTLFVHDVNQILFVAFCSQLQLSTNCRQLRIAAFDRIPIGTGIFALFERFGDVDSANPLLGSPPNGAHGDILKKDQNLYHRSTTSICLHRILILYHIPLLEASTYNDTAQKL